MRDFHSMSLTPRSVSNPRTTLAKPSRVTLRCEGTGVRIVAFVLLAGTLASGADGVVDNSAAFGVGCPGRVAVVVVVAPASAPGPNTGAAAAGVVVVLVVAVVVVVTDVVVAVAVVVVAVVVVMPHVPHSRRQLSMTVG